MTRINGRNGRRAAAVAAGVATSLIVGGSAYAYFTGTGSGAGAAKVGVGDTILSVAVDPTTGPLFPSNPGGYKGDLRLTFTSPVAATVTGIARDMSRSVMVNGGVVGPTPCLGTVITLDTITGLNISVPATPGHSPRQSWALSDGLQRSGVLSERELQYPRHPDRIGIVMNRRLTGAFGLAAAAVIGSTVPAWAFWTLTSDPASTAGAKAGNLLAAPLVQVDRTGNGNDIKVHFRIPVVPGVHPTNFTVSRKVQGGGTTYNPIAGCINIDVSLTCTSTDSSNNGAPGIQDLHHGGRVLEVTGQPLRLPELRGHARQHLDELLGVHLRGTSGC